MDCVSWETFYSNAASWKACCSYRLVVWEKPLQGHYKLNTNGRSLGNPSASGGRVVLRDS